MASASTSIPPEEQDQDGTNKPDMDQWELLGDVSTFPFESVIASTCHARFRCTICSQPLSNPVSVSPCGHIFDEHCIRAVMAGAGAMASKLCPKGCVDPIERTTRLPEMRQLVMETVKAKCIHAECGDVMEVDLLVDHLQRTCVHSRFRCKLQGADGAVCGSEVARDGMASHEGVCKNASIRCRYEGCGRRFLREALGAHMAVCDFRPTVCAKCNQSYPFKDTKTHPSTCPEEPFACPLCFEVVRRCAMSTHLQSIQSIGRHVGALAEKMAVCGEGLPPPERAVRAQEELEGMCARVEAAEASARRAAQEVDKLRQELREATRAAGTAPTTRSDMSPRECEGLQISGAVEVRWTADLTRAIKVQSHVQSPPFACCGWLFYLRVYLEGSIASEKKWGLFCGCLGPATADVSKALPGMHVTAVRAECTAEIPQVSFRKTLVAGEVLNGPKGWNAACTLDALQTSLTVHARVSRIEVKFKYT